MWVAPDHRSLGAGKLLLEAVIAWAKEKNASYLVLGVTYRDSPAMRLYQRAGFAPVGAARAVTAGIGIVGPVNAARAEKGNRMTMDKKIPKDIDEYIAGFPPEVQQILEHIRATIKAAAPEAQETISYQMPTFTLKGNLVHFAAFKKHIGFYPTPSGTEQFQQQISGYKAAKGSIQFPLDKPIPYDLISEIVNFRVQENLAKAEAKAKAKKKKT